MKHHHPTAVLDMYSVSQEKVTRFDRGECRRVAGHICVEHGPDGAPVDIYYAYMYYGDRGERDYETHVFVGPRARQGAGPVDGGADMVLSGCATETAINHVVAYYWRGIKEGRALGIREVGRRVAAWQGELESIAKLADHP